MSDLKAELALRKAALSDPIKYIEYLRPENLQDFDKEPAQHHYLLARELRDMAEGKSLQTAVSEPPGSAKSFYCSIVFPTLLVARDPSHKVLALTSSESLGEDFSIRRRQIFRSQRWQNLASTSLSPDAQSLQKQLTLQGGGVYTFGAGSNIQGFRCNTIVADDLVSGYEVAGSLSQLDKLWNWYISEARARLVDFLAWHCGPSEAPDILDALLATDDTLLARGGTRTTHESLGRLLHSGSVSLANPVWVFP